MRNAARHVAGLAVLGVLLALNVAACGTLFETPQKREYTRTDVRMYWVEVDNQEQLYAQCGQPKKGERWLACALMSADRSTCTVVSYRGASFDILGHEFLHCFAGYWHG